MSALSVVRVRSSLSSWMFSAGRILFPAVAAGLTCTVALAQGATPLSREASAPLAGVLVDANGTPMGPFYPLAWGSTPAPGVLLLLDGQPVLLPLRASRQAGHPDGAIPIGNHGAVLFERRDCTGPAWIVATDFPAALTPRRSCRTDPRT